MTQEKVLRAMFDAAVAAADPMETLAAHLPARPEGRTIVIGAGKASARMAQALEAAWDGPLEGLVVTRYGHSAPCAQIRIVEAAHPTPDAAGVSATRDILALLEGLTAADLVIALISGGGSALLCAPAGDLSLEAKQAVTQGLLRCGAPIGAMNTVRKHLSAVKGGRLAAAAAPAKVHALMISDVPGDDPAVIASGPTMPEHSAPADALAILRRYGVALPADVARHLETTDLPPADLPDVTNRIIAAPQLSLEAAAEVARRAGYAPLILGDAIEGESREVAKVHAGIAAQVLTHGQPLPAPCALISGGETSVTLRGNGRGGRNVEFALALALALGGRERVSAIACDTDGVDGIEEVAGAVVTPSTLERATKAGLDAAAMLDNNDAHRFFEALGDQIITGPTLTNVNDFRALLID